MADDLQTRFQQAVEQHQAGRTTEAILLYRSILRDDPQHIPTPYFLGTALLQTNDIEASIEQLAHFISKQPDIPDAHNNLGVAHKALGNWQQAVDCFQAAIDIDAEYTSAIYNLAQLLAEQGNHAGAETWYRQLICTHPQDVAACGELVKSLMAQDKWDEAEATLKRAVSNSADAPIPHSNRTTHCELRGQLAYLYVQQARLDDAIAEYKSILADWPDFHQIHNSLSYVYERSGNFEAAEAAARQAIELTPDDAAAHNNLGQTLQSQHHLDTACASFSEAIRLRPDFALAHFNLGFTHLLAGRLAEGWPEYQYHAVLNPAPARTWAEPRWNGEPLADKKLLIYSDQGFGDAIQFSRFLIRLQEQTGCQLVVECQPALVDILKTLPVDAIWISEGESLPEFDFHFSMADLPAQLNATLENCLCSSAANTQNNNRSSPGYLKPPTSVRPELAVALGQLDPNRKKIGIIWQGNRQQARDHLRSCPWSTLEPLLEMAGIQWVSLQREAHEMALVDECGHANRPLNFGPMLHDFSETAALLMELDLVISVDTAVAHLAGALGRPIWTMLCHTPDWRWLLNRNDSPWYPTMRLFRQPAWGDWQSVIGNVGEELNRIVSNDAR